ncbi:MULTISPECIES: hypothetical protein [unclassified Ruminococcus]|uniref:hypothetical protein n=1 Tax=unclassified Ruminococcus TaxID=2608920 RepID=UPI00210C18F8|nr:MULTISPECIES: hypothetical protein [unclassified Ruminococcus]MCQ4021532.1 hypothetical protein [Ruminococcus sp. zg-924]MCQ4113977.1 hypothetical protein [Ruminococcus sp. zg-921]
MVEAYLIKADGSRLALEKIMSFTVNREIGAADDLTICLAQGGLGNLNASRIELKIGGHIEFSGIIDELSISESRSGELTVIYARSTAGILLDNEAKPADYNNADSALIVQNHIAPFGIDCICDDDGEYTDISIFKGVSHWQVIKSFCDKCYGKEPYVNEEGKVVLCEKDSDETLYFCNSGGIPYSSAIVNSKYYKLISSVHTKALGRAEYDIEHTNELAKELGIIRTRYADGEQSGNDAGIRMIESGNESSLEVRITVPSFVHCTLNCRCAVKLNSGRRYESLRCVKVKLSLSRNGFETAVVLSGIMEGRE